MDFLLERSIETKKILIWNFFASNHGGSACDADANTAQMFLKNYVQNNSISLKDKETEIIALINKINRHVATQLSPEDKKYEYDFPLFARVLYPILTL